MSVLFTAVTGHTAKARITLPGGRVVSAERFPIVPGGLAQAPTVDNNLPETGWFWNPSQGGRGWAIEVQGNTVFMAMFHYNPDGSPTWNIVTGDMSGGQITADFLHYTGGQSLTGVYKAPQNPTSSYEYALNFANACSGGAAPQGVAGEQLQRFLFGFKSPLCGQGVTYNQPMATLQSPGDGKLPWNVAIATRVDLRDATGQLVSAPLICTALDEMITVASDCSNMTAKRLGALRVRVEGVLPGSGAKLLATLQIQGTVPRSWSGVRGMAGATGNGGFNLLALPDGATAAWGSNESGLLAQNRSYAGLAALNAPQPVLNTAGDAALRGVAQLGTGESTAFALAESGSLWAWGRNNGTLGRDDVLDNTFTPRSVRNPANDNDLGGVVQAEMGGGNAVALLHDGTVLSWGSWTGSGSTGAKVFPVQVKNPAGNDILRNIVAVSAGNTFALALGGDGRVYAWGSDGNAGRLGAGARLGVPSALPNTVKKADGSELGRIVAISSGWGYSLALADDGIVWGWGDNSVGQLAQGKYDANGVPYAVQLKAVNGQGTLNDIAMVAAGGSHALALSRQGTVYAWGSATKGQLGDGIRRPAGNSAAFPLAVVSEVGSGQLADVVSVAAGYGHSLALKRNGTVLAWGNNLAGELGQGGVKKIDYLTVPTPVIGRDGPTQSLILAPLSAYPNLLRRAR
ncbi:hypothetical protein [Andreprevotia sp. IGB-42]|uniref:RCC1 domain-containing protein n=1 Tax=Andreprevotia sp. IGB-42 TaxID=2497473 RepID=UPI001357DFE4|nr:hypothetical protein [Andreprevotia sp. IGB-42]